MLGSGLKEFWSKCRIDDPRFVNNPLLDMPNWMERAVPFTVHGDDVQFTKLANSITAISYGSMLSSLWVLGCILCACFPKTCAATKLEFGNIQEHDAWWVIWQYIKHSFDALFYGYHPRKKTRW